MVSKIIPYINYNGLMCKSCNYTYQIDSVDVPRRNVELNTLRTRIYEHEILI